MMVYENGKVSDMSIYNEADKLRLRDIRLESLAWELRP